MSNFLDDDCVVCDETRKFLSIILAYRSSCRSDQIFLDLLMEQSLIQNRRTIPKP